MDNTNAERQRRYIRRLKERAVSNGGETEEETDQRIKNLEETIKELTGYRREAERLQRKLANEPPPDIHNGMTVPERIQQHLSAAYDLMRTDLELPRNQRKKAKLDKIFSHLNHVVEEFNRWLAASRP